MTYRTSKLLISEPPIHVLPSLAKAIGLNAAIVLQQIHYWITKNLEKADHWHDDRCWVYNSYEDWREKNFPFWSVDTIKRAIIELKKLGLVIVGNFNRKGYDRTNWYTIDYDRLEELADSLEPTGANSTNGQGRSTPPIPETNSRDIPLKGKDTFDRFAASRENGYLVLRRPLPGILNRDKRRKAGQLHECDQPSNQVRSA